MDMPRSASWLTGLATVCMALTWLSGAAQADESDIPAVTVSIDTDTDELESGDTVVYRVTVRNDDSDEVDLDIDLTAPDRARAIVASEDGSLDGPTVTWPMTVLAGEEMRVQTALATGVIRDGLRGYPVRACADIGDDVPLTCSTEITQVAGQPDVRTGQTEEDGGGPNWPVVLVGGAGGGLIAYFVRNRHRPSVPTS